MKYEGMERTDRTITPKLVYGEDGAWLRKLPTAKREQIADLLVQAYLDGKRTGTKEKVKARR